MNKTGNSIILTKSGMLVGILLSTAIAWLTSFLDVSMAIIATGTSLFFGLCAASFLPAYVGALYVKALPKAAAIWGMVCGFTSSFFWIFFMHKKESSSLQLCKLLTGRDSLVDGTALAQLNMVDPIFIALPVSIIVTVVLALVLKKNTDKKLVEKCFAGIG